MKVKEREGWDKLDRAFQVWYLNSYAEWPEQKKWLSEQLVERGYIKKKQLKKMWELFHGLVDQTSSWRFQSKVLSFITLCLQPNIGEDLARLVK